MARKKRTTRRRSSRKRRKSKRKSSRSRFPWLKILLSLLVVLLAYVVFLDIRLHRQFEGTRWSLPARVYARPLELYTGLRLTAEQFADELRALGYRSVRVARKAGEVSRNGNRFQFISRPFVFWDGQEPSQSIRVTFSSTHLKRLQDDRNGGPLALARLDPLAIGSIHTARQEDRILLRLEDVPDSLVDALIAVEDRNFRSHYGVSPPAIARALWVNLN
jgi:penicillin-binding protein 1B